MCVNNVWFDCIYLLSTKPTPTAVNPACLNGFFGGADINTKHKIDVTMSLLVSKALLASHRKRNQDAPFFLVYRKKFLQAKKRGTSDCILYPASSPVLPFVNPRVWHPQKLLSLQLRVRIRIRYSHGDTASS